MYKIFLSVIVYLSICFSAFSQGSVTINLKNADPLKGTMFYMQCYKGIDIKIIDSVKYDGASPVVLKFKDTIVGGMYEVFFTSGGRQQVYPLVISPKENNVVFDLDNNNLNQFIVPPVNNENKAFAELLDAYIKMNGDIPAAYAKHQLKNGDDTINYKKQMLAVDSVNMNFANTAAKINKKYKGTYAGEILGPIMSVKISKELFGTMSLAARTYYTLEHFFDDWNFKDERLVNNPFIREALKYYFNNIYPKENDFDKNPAERLTRSVNVVLARAMANEKVNEFILNYTIDYFFRRGPGEIILFIYDNYYSGCTSGLNEQTLERIKELINIKPGHIAPDFTLPNEYGKEIKLSSVTGKGPVLLLFWASWCKHCKEETPQYLSIYNEYKAKGFQVLAISLDEDKAQWLSFISMHKLGWTNISDLKKFNSEVSRLYFIYNTPTTFLIDKEGKIIQKNLKPSELKEELKKIYK